MKILLVEPGKVPECREIDGALRTMQELVGGTIQAICPFDDSVALICNDEGKLLGLPGNRTLRDEEGALYDIICGTFFVCGVSVESENSVGLTEELAEKYMKHFWIPEMFVNINGHIVVLPMI